MNESADDTFASDLPALDVEIDGLDENRNFPSSASNSADHSGESARKVGYYDRKLENRLRKYEAYLKKHENINRIDYESQFLFVGNGGLENNISESFLVETFEKFGSLIDVVMPKRKSYAFVIYADKRASTRALQHLQAQEITRNQTPIFFYMFPVDRVPESDDGENTLTNYNLPPGLVYLENYVNATEAHELVEFFTTTTTTITSEPQQTERGSKTSNVVSSDEFIDLKKRRVKHYGYEFRYGTNDCDLTQPLTEPDKRMPELCNRLIERMLADNLIHARPDQLTVNFYEPGHGIGPHVDNVNAFDDFIISLSLISSVVMEFKHKQKAGQMTRLLLEPNSLLILKGESRYEWTHCIPERKHDIVTGGSKDNNRLVEVRPRGKRISLTFRKVKPVTKGVSCESTERENESTTRLVLPTNELEAVEFEKSHVHQVYNQIATHFSETRYSTWPGVAKFITSMQAYSTMLDVGCGNGKYLGFRRDLICFGCDYSDQLIRICHERGFQCFVSDCLRIPCRDNHFDYLICIAVLHHLSTDERRIKAIVEMNRVLKKGGQALITVWAKEQKYKEKESFYISSKSGKGSGGKKTDVAVESDEKAAGESTNVHTFGKEFENKDVFVAWRMKNKKKSGGESGEKSSQSVVEEVPSAEKTSEQAPSVYLRFYHVFEQNELESLFQDIPGTRIVESFYEQGNWCLIFQKT